MFQRKFITLFLAFSALFLMSNSCEDDAVEVAKLNGGVKATVTTAYSNEGCPYLMEVDGESGKELLMPINLDNQFKVNGTVVLMKYTVSRIQQTDCLKGMPIVIDEIVPFTN